MNWKAKRNGQLATPDKRTKKRKCDRWARYNRLIDEIGPGLDSASQLAILACLFRHERNGTASVSHGKIAKSVGLSKRHVNRVIAQLVKSQLIHVVKKGSNFDKNAPSQFRLTW